MLKLLMGRIYTSGMLHRNHNKGIFYVPLFVLRFMKNDMQAHSAVSGHFFSRVFIEPVNTL